MFTVSSPSNTTLHYTKFSHHSVSEHHVTPFRPTRNNFKHRFPSHSAQPYAFRHIPRNVRGRTYSERITVNRLSSLRRLVSLRCSLQASYAVEWRLSTRKVIWGYKNWEGENEHIWTLTLNISGKQYIIRLGRTRKTKKMSDGIAAGRGQIRSAPHWVHIHTLQKSVCLPVTNFLIKVFIFPNH